MPSIQRKIQAGYYAFAAAVAGLALLASSELAYLERHMAPDLAASRLLDSVLEIRRYEKNWLLYGGEGTLAEVRSFAEQTRSLIAEARPRLAGLGGTVELDRLERALADYLAALGKYAERLPGGGTRRDAAGADPGADMVEAAGAADREGETDAQGALALRQAGRRLAEGAEAIAKTQHARLQRAIGQSRAAVLATGALAFLLAALAAQWLARRTTRPLGLLVDRLQAIAEGRYGEVAPVSSDREILAVTGAVNRMLAELESRRRRLVQAEKLASLGTLVSGVAHELNNPLSNISSSCQILAEELRRATPRAPGPDLGGGQSEGLGEWLEQIDRETERARVIVRSLLDFGREAPFDKRSVALGALVERTLRLIPRSLRRGRVAVQVPAELRVAADPQRLQQVLLNLIRNALDASADTPTQVTVRAEPRDPARFQLPEHAVCGRSATPSAPHGRLVLITVEDDGPGIPPDLLPRVFDPFFTTKDVGHGSGLGLYVSQEIVEQHGGCIAVESRPGAGARFYVALPD